MPKNYTEIKDASGVVYASPRPSASDLATFYADQYYQKPPVTYKAKYPDEELNYYDNLAKVAEHIFLQYNERKCLLDLGCGEGYFSKYFSEIGWENLCVDFSSFGLINHNKKLEQNFRQGDIIQVLENLIIENKKFSHANLQNVLEHVLDPSKMLDLIASVLDDNGVLRIRVPNDYSDFQKLLIDKGIVKNTWFVPPEHLNYFNATNFKKFVETTKFEIISLQVDFPIEIFLSNQHSNYWNNRSIGSDAHASRLLVENHLMSKSIIDYISYSEAAARLDFGRELVVYLKKK
jgi:SAM-dependent methyltransferase